MLPCNLFANALIPLVSADGHLLDLAPLMLGCLVTIALGAALGRLACRWTGKTDAARATTMLACCCANSGAIPMLLMQSLCSDASTALHGTAGCAPPEGYPALFGIAMNVCFWTWGVNVCKLAEQGADDEADEAAIPLTIASTRDGSPALKPVGAGMKRSRSDVFDPRPGTPEVDKFVQPEVIKGGMEEGPTSPLDTGLVRQRSYEGHDIEGSGESTDSASDSSSDRGPTTSGGPPALTLDVQPAAEPELPDTPMPVATAQQPKSRWLGGLTLSIRQRLAQRLIEGTQYTLVPVQDPSSPPLTSASDAGMEEQDGCFAGLSAQALELLHMPPNAAIGQCPQSTDSHVRMSFG